VFVQFLVYYNCVRVCHLLRSLLGSVLFLEVCMCSITSGIVEYCKLLPIRDVKYFALIVIVISSSLFEVFTLVMMILSFLCNDVL